MSRWLTYFGQAVLYGAFIAVIGFFSAAPAYEHLPEDMAVIKVSFTHASRIIGKCRKPTKEELAGLPLNMQPREICPRERSPVVLDLLLDGEPLYHTTLLPSGLNRDGSSTVYRRFTVPAGTYALEVSMNDSVHVKGYTHTRKGNVQLAPAQVFVIDFNNSKSEFVFD